MDIDEGILDENFGGRKLEIVSIQTRAEYIGEAGSAKDQAEERKYSAKAKADGSEILLLLDRKDPERNGISWNKMHDLSSLSPRRMEIAVDALVQAGLVEDIPDLEITTGKGAKRKSRALRQPPKNDQVIMSTDQV